MTNFYFWSGIEQAWADTENCPLQSLTGLINSPAKGDNSWALVKRESRVRLILIDQDSAKERLICKIYRVPGKLGWRTFGMVSRANREFTALMEAHRSGLPIVRPHSWRDARRFACLTFSAITLKVVQGNNLEDLLAGSELTPENRRQLAADKGRLLAKLHAAGMYWGTAYPRNVMVQPSADPSLLVIDTPYSQWHKQELAGSASALDDLRSAVQVTADGVGFSAAERYELLSAYCGDNTALLESLLAQLKPRRRVVKKWQRLSSRISNVMFRSPRSRGSGGVYSQDDGQYQSDRLNPAAEVEGQSDRSEKL